MNFRNHVRAASGRASSQSASLRRKANKAFGSAVRSSIERLEKRFMLSTTVFKDDYSQNTAANYAESSSGGTDSFTVANGILNYARTDTTAGWNSSVFLLNPSVANTQLYPVFTTSGDFIGDKSYPGTGNYYQPGLILSGDPTNGGFVVMEFENGKYQYHLALLRETGGQLLGDEGGTGTPPVLEDYGSIQANLTDTYHVSGTVDRTGANPVITVSITDTTTGQVIANSMSTTDTFDPPSYGGNQIGWRARFDNAVADLGYDNLQLDNDTPPADHAPAAPSNLTAVQGNAINVNLAWTNNADNELTFQVERSTDGTNFTSIGGSGKVAQGAQQTFTDTNTVVGQTYYYRVEAFNGFNGGTLSAPSNVAKVTIGTPTTGAMAHYYSQSEWNGNPAVSTFVPNVNEIWGTGSPAPGIIPNSNNSTIFTGKIKTEEAGTYTFVSNTDDEGWLYVDGVLVSDDPGGHGLRDATALTPISLAANTSYDFVFLQDQGGGGSGANIEWVTPNNAGNAPVIIPVANYTPFSDAPSAVSKLALDTAATGANPGPNAVEFTFQSNNIGTVQYQLQRSSDGGTTWTTVNSVWPGGATQNTDNTISSNPSLLIQDATAQPGQSYKYRVVGVNFDTAELLDQTGTASNVLSVNTTKSTQQPGAEEHIYHGALASAVAGLDARSINLLGTPTEYIDDSVAAGGGTIDTGFNGAPAGAENGQTDPDVTPYPDIPRVFGNAWSIVYTGKVVTDGAGVYTFVSNTDDDGYLFVNGQLVSQDPGGHGQEDAPVLTPISLAANTAYNFQLIMDNTGGGAGAHMEWIEPGQTAAAVIPAYTPAAAGTPAAGGLQQVSDLPAAPTSLIVTQTGASGNFLRWTDNSTSELEYEIQRSSDGGTTWTTVGMVPMDHTGFTDTTATAATAYMYRVRGDNFDGNGAFSNTASTATVTPVASFTDDYSTDSTANYTESAQGHPNPAGTPGLQDSWTVANGTLNYSVTANSGWNTTVLLLNPSVANTSGMPISVTSGDISAPVNFQPGLVLSGDTTGGGFLVEEYDNGALVNHLVLLRETGSQMQGDEGGTGTPIPVLADFGDISAHNTDTFHISGTIDRTGAHPVITVTVTDLTNPSFIIAPKTVTDTTDPASYGGTQIGWRTRYMDATAKFSVDNLSLQESVTGGGGTVSTLNDAGGNTYTFTNDADGTDVDVSGPGITGSQKVAPVLTITDTGAADNLVFTGGTAVPKSLILNGTFVVSSATSLTQLQGYLKSAQIKSGKADPNYALADVVLPASGGTQLNTRLKGDINGDGKVDFKDLVILAANYNGTGADWSKGDFTYDGKVGFADLVALAGNYNKTATAVASQSLSAAVQVGTKSATHHASPAKRKR